MLKMLCLNGSRLKTHSFTVLFHHSEFVVSCRAKRGSCSRDYNTSRRWPTGQVQEIKVCLIISLVFKTLCQQMLTQKYPAPSLGLPLFIKKIELLFELIKYINCHDLCEFNFYSLSCKCEVQRKALSKVLIGLTFCIQY